jgi:carbon-monoxide dehydrogenase medium subunit
MPSVLAYHRPGSLDEAATLLAGPNRRAIGGGTIAVPDARIARDRGVEVVDLQALGLDDVDADGNSLTLGAMVRLGDLATDDRVPVLLADLARRELPSALRNQATVGGTVAMADWESVLTAGLLVHAASVSLHDIGAVPLAALLAEGVGQRIITTVTVQAGGVGAIAATGRTPADVPIVAAVARAADDGVRVALTGVAAVPVLVDTDDPTAGLSPAGDFRGSADYRLHLAATLTQRAIKAVGQ